MDETEPFELVSRILPTEELALSSVDQPLQELSFAFDYYVLQRAEALVSLFTSLDPAEKLRAGFHLYMNGSFDGVLHGLQHSPEAELDTLSRFTPRDPVPWQDVQELYGMAAENARILQNTIEATHPEATNDEEKRLAMQYFLITLDGLVTSWQQAKALEQHEHTKELILNAA